MDSSDVKKVARLSRDSTTFRFLARAGLAVNGLVNAIIGLIAIGIAGAGGGSADQSGAFAAISATPGGQVLLWGIVIAFAALGLWYLIESFFTYGKDTKRRVANIAAEVGKGIAYLLLAGAAFGFVQGPGEDSASQTTAITAQLMAAPGGILVIVALGLLFCGIGAYLVRKGVIRSFERDIVIPSPPADKAVKTVGIFGYVARGIALSIVGILFIVATFTVDPSKATGLDGALKVLAGLPFGQVILAVVGLGFIAYGVYSVLRSRLANLR